MDDIHEFLDEFDHYAHEVSVARHQDFQRALLIWFQTLESAPEPLRSRIEWLRNHFPADKLKSDVIIEGRGMVGSGKLNWPLVLEDRLSSQLLLLEALTEKEDSAWQFAFGFFPGGGRNIDGTLAQLVDGLFEPHTRELRRYLSKNANTPIANGIPAADRIVSLDHNSSAHAEADAALADVEEKVQQANEGNPDEKERVVAEIGAARRLLKATKVRIGALVGVLGLALSWIANQFAETAAGHAAELAIRKLIEYLPILSGLF